jgi:hypothetical protein
VLEVQKPLNLSNFQLLGIVDGLMLAEIINAVTIHNFFLDQLNALPKELNSGLLSSFSSTFLYPLALVIRKNLVLSSLEL